MHMGFLDIIVLPNIMAKTVETGCTNVASLQIQSWEQEAHNTSEAVWQTTRKTTLVEAEEYKLL